MSEKLAIKAFDAQVTADFQFRGEFCEVLHSDQTEWKELGELQVLDLRSS